MSDKQSYMGGCHCGAVAYRVEMSLDGLITCNCSYCTQMGWILGFVPAEAFVLLKGEDQLTQYQFNKKTIQHLFCKQCGVHSFCRGTSSDGSQMCGINVRCLEGVDVEQLKPTMMDGKNR